MKSARRLSIALGALLSLLSWSGAVEAQLPCPGEGPEEGLRAVARMRAEGRPGDALRCLDHLQRQAPDPAIARARAQIRGEMVTVILRGGGGHHLRTGGQTYRLPIPHPIYFPPGRIHLEVVDPRSGALVQRLDREAGAGERLLLRLPGRSHRLYHGPPPEARPAGRGSGGEQLIGPLTLGGLGVAGIVAGAAMIGHGSSLGVSLDVSPCWGPSPCSSSDREGNGLYIAGTALTVTGVALALSGVIWLAVAATRVRERRGGGVALAPWFRSDAGRLEAGLSFGLRWGRS